jgi:hypothetical protein
MMMMMILAIIQQTVNKINFKNQSTSLSYPLLSGLRQSIQYAQKSGENKNFVVQTIFIYCKWESSLTAISAYSIN